MNRTTLSLIGAVVALAAASGLAAVEAPHGSAHTTAAGASRLPVQRSSLLCPPPTSSDVGDTAYTSFTPKGTGAARSGSARLYPATTAQQDGAGASSGKDGKSDKKGKKNGDSGKGAKGGAATQPVVTEKEAGRPTTTSTDSSDASALYGTADGALAPGWTVQQTTSVAAGNGRGLSGMACTAPDTDFWFAGASTAAGRQDYVHLTNPDATAAVVDVQLRGKDGAIDTPTGDNLTVPPHSSLPVLLSTLTGTETDGVGVHVVAREGRIGAALQASDENTGGDWLPAPADPGDSAVLPGIPSDATSVELNAVATTSADADLKVQLATPTGLITPAGAETVHVKGGMTTRLKLPGLTKGDAGSLVLTPTDPNTKAPFAASLRVVRGTGSDQEMAFVPATGPVEAHATAADNSAKGTTLSLVAPEKGRDAHVTLVASAGSGGGTPVSKSYTVKGGTTLAVTDPPRPKGLKGTYALTVEPQGGGPVYAARTLAQEQDGVPAFTIQALPDDGGVVRVPSTRSDLSLLTR